MPATPPPLFFFSSGVVNHDFHHPFPSSFQTRSLYENRKRRREARGLSKLPRFGQSINRFSGQCIETSHDVKLEWEAEEDEPGANAKVDANADPDANVDASTNAMDDVGLVRMSLPCSLRPIITPHAWARPPTTIQ